MCVRIRGRERRRSRYRLSLSFTRFILYFFLSFLLCREGRDNEKSSHARAGVLRFSERGFFEGEPRTREEKRGEVFRVLGQGRLIPPQACVASSLGERDAT